jgi:hypothetical protein
VFSKTNIGGAWVAEGGEFMGWEQLCQWNGCQARTEGSLDGFAALSLRARIIDWRLGDANLRTNVP